MLKFLFDKVILVYPKIVLLIICLAIAIVGYQARKLEIDASAETLILENDQDLQFTRLVTERYGSQDFLVISYTPRKDLFSDTVLNDLKLLRNELTQLDGVDSVTTILDVPLLESPPRPIKELLSNIPTLSSPNIDRELARNEFRNSPIYSDLLVSPDMRTTALQINLSDDPLFKQLLTRRNELRVKGSSGLNKSEQEELADISLRFKAHRDMKRADLHHLIIQTREIMGKHEESAELFLGGVSMIADDLITFIKNDLRIFGIGVICLLALTLGIIFKQRQWIVFPLICSLLSVVTTCGLLGIFGWEVTVISSNFISLQMIITMAIAIHLIVRYRELVCHHPAKNQHELVLETVLSMIKPCCYAILTTVAGFSSLILCNILPVINFGWMMSAGISLSLLLTFLIFPCMLMLMHKQIPKNCQISSSFTSNLASFTHKHGSLVLSASFLLLIVSIFGISRLIVENSFIDYFRPTTEIYQGMKIIDEQLGGTTPLEVVIDFPAEESINQPQEAAEVEDIFSELDAEFSAEQDEAQYWFTTEKMERIEAVHNYLDSLPQTGKVLSLGTMLKVGRRINNNQDLDNFKLALIYNELPEKFRDIILAPYVSVENDQVRFSIRVRDSDKHLRRNQLLKTIRSDISEKLHFEADDVRLAGLLLLYNNMLQSLFSSQIMTLGAVVLALMFMFLILFQSIKVALIAIFPNLLSVGTVLGFMGLAGIPLDMMTITIAAISVGIAVDNTIHYIHRFKKEYIFDKDYQAAMRRSHGSIAYAMYYTSITVIIGFSILVLSNFIPSIYFGLLTGLAMVIALLAALTLLPHLLIIVKPFGPDYLD